MLTTSLAMAQGAGDIRQRARGVMDRQPYQVEFNNKHNETEQKSARSGNESTGSGRSYDSISSSQLGQILLWILLIIAGAVAGILLVKLLRERDERSIALKTKSKKSPKAKQAKVAHIVPKKSAPTETVLKNADQLAGSGELTEALHILLLDVIAAIVPKAGGDNPSWTSRELLSQFKLDADQALAFRKLVYAVEEPLFGRAAVSLSLFKECKQLARLFLDGVSS